MILAAALLQSCTKGTPYADKFPDTQLSVKEINLTGDERLNSTVKLNWFGFDSDGYITGYEISFDNKVWSYTERVDSTFSFSIPSGQDTADVDFWVRAIDNENQRDQSPAHLSIPLKNSAPTASFNNEFGPRDTALIVSTFSWSATDPDGDGTIASVEIKFNNGSWYALNQGSSIISFLLDTAVQTGSAQADVYYDQVLTPVSQKIDGLLPNAVNSLYIRATDIAGAVSKVDTAIAYFLKNKTPNTNLLWVTGQGAGTSQKYADVLNPIGIKYDRLDYGADINGANMPSYWSPTFTLISSLYPKLFVNSDQTTFKNRVTSRILTLLEFMGPSVQEFTNNGGKSFITTSFNKEQNLSEITGPYPVSSLVVSSAGQARIYPDSGLVTVMTGPYPNVNPPSNNLQTGVVPIVGTTDSEDFYRGRLTKLNNWQGTDIVGVVRRPNGIWSQVLFGVELHNYNANPTNLQLLFEEILVNEF